MTTWLVCGGRDLTDGVAAALDDLSSRRGKPGRLICGGARGADVLAIEWALGREIAAKAFVRCRFGRAAGPIRNQRMLDEGKPDLVVAFPGGAETADMVRRARKAGVEIVEVELGREAYSADRRSCARIRGLAWQARRGRGWTG